MALLSKNAQKALDQVKMGLLVLYGADYFSDEEWFRIDHLVHKGKYVFTHGPSVHMLDEPLMSFAEPKKDISMLIESDEKKENDITLVEEQTEPTSSGVNDSSNSESGTLTFLSENNFADGKSPSSPAPATEQTTPESSGGPVLPTGYTKAQLEESKAFQSQVKHKSRSLLETRWGGTSIDYAGLESPLPTETLVSSWASEVGEVDDTGSLHQSISTLALQDEASKSSASSTKPLTLLQVKEALYRDFVERHNGREPTSEGDYWQPNNPEFKGLGLKPTPSSRYAQSVASVTSSSRWKSPKPINPLSRPKINSIGEIGSGILPPGVYYATQNQRVNGIQLEVKAGDHIQVIKFVSGKFYNCMNIETREFGQVAGTILEKENQEAKPNDSSSAPQKAQSNFNSPIVKPQQPHAEKWPSRGNGATEKDAGEANQSDVHAKEHLANGATATGSTSESLIDHEPKKIMSNWNVAPSIDMIETLNAAEWDEDPAQRPKPAVWKSPSSARLASRAAIPPSTSSSRLAALPDEGNNSAVTAAMQAAINRGVREALGSQMDNIRHTLSPSTKPYHPSVPKSNSFRKESEPPLVPKTNTCWFWATNKGCRFTDEECRDLHSHNNALGEPTNFHNGKPTWGAAADYASSSPAAHDVADGDKKKFTCWFWAQNGKCMYSDEDCKYSHEQAPGGVARPRQWKNPIRDSWRRGGESSWDSASIAPSVRSGPPGEDKERAMSMRDSWGGARNGTAGEEKEPVMSGRDDWGGARNGTAREEKEPATSVRDDWGGEQPAYVQDLESRLQQEAVGW